MDVEVEPPRPNVKLLTPKGSTHIPDVGPIFISMYHFCMQELAQGPGLLL